MKKIFLLSLSFAIVVISANAQGFGDLIKKNTKKDSTGKSGIGKVLDKIPGSGTSSGSGLSNDDIVSGLKEALRVGTDSSSKKLSKLDGFFGDAAIKILMPDEAKKVESSLRSMGMGGMVDKAILSMNRAAEDAASGVGNIFWNSIKGMSVSDGIGILRGGDFAATDYLKKTTTSELTEKFRPVIEASLTKVDATKYWKEVFSKYNMFATKKVETDLTAYVTEKALSGLFYNISLEEQKIRKDPAAQVTDLLKKVFGK
ncbi:MAG: DUF4197 domain-containing protein [Bacteroidota bacterium]